MRAWTVVIGLVGLVGFAGCGEEEEPAGTSDPSETEEAVDYSEFCDTYCTQGLADVEASGCANVMPYTDDDVASCVDTCVAQTSIAVCGELSVTFWQCTLDEYPGNFTCDAGGNVVQPDSCGDEQQAVLDCFNN